MNKREENILLIEYKKSQDSAEHYNTLSWTISSIFLAGLFTLIGYLLSFSESLKSNELKILNTLGLTASDALAFFGMLTAVLLLIFIWQHREIRNKKYNRCKNIEEYIKINNKQIMNQHTNVDKINKWYFNIKGIYMLSVLIGLIIILFFLLLSSTHMQLIIFYILISIIAVGMIISLLLKLLKNNHSSQT